MNPTNVSMAVPWTLTGKGHGAYLWIFINWALGLRAAGYRVRWVEGTSRASSRLSPDDVAAAIRNLQERLRPFGLAEGFVLVSFEDGETLFAEDSGDVFDADLLLNFVYGAPEGFVRRFPRSALVDIDPGLLQIWMSRGDVRVAGHDTWFTIGETVGTEHARFPDCGIEWIFTPPPVYLPEWPVTAAVEGGKFTAVTGWWDEWMELNGETFSNEKRSAFLEYLDLPVRSASRLELAIILDDLTAATDVPLLNRHGWSVGDARGICESPGHFRRYIQGSRGEFTCSRPSSRRLGTTWMSDRTLCYLASGKPAIVESTAPGRFEFDDGGLLRFSSLEEAEAALSEISQNYDDHCRAARQIAERHFDAVRIARTVVERALR